MAYSYILLSYNSPYLINRVLLAYLLASKRYRCTGFSIVVTFSLNTILILIILTTFHGIHLGSVLLNSTKHITYLLVVGPI